MPPRAVLIKPASGLCNLACGYCFYRDEMQHRAIASCGMMQPEVLERTIQAVFEGADGPVYLAFQGGEPMLAGLPFFEAAVRLAAEHNPNRLPVQFSIQTNGTLIDEAWAEFFHTNRFLVGLSIDGVRETHNAARKGKNGEDTYDTVRKAAKLLDRFRVEYNILTVVTAQVARRIESIYRNYRQNGWRYLQFIPCLDPLESDAPQPWTLTESAYAQFLQTLWNLWQRDLQNGEPVSIRQFDNWQNMLRGLPPESCGMSGICAFQCVVEADGSVYPCDFYVLDEWRLGNFNEQSYAEICAAYERSGFEARSRALPAECERCPSRWLCRGGCFRERVGGKYRFCETMRALGAALSRRG